MSSLPSHILSPTSLTLAETQALFDVAKQLKRDRFSTALARKAIGLIFFNPSLRTRTSMDIAAWQLGGHAVTLDVGVGTWKLEHREGKVMDGDAAEHVKEAVKVMSRYVDALGVRSFPEGVSWSDDKVDPIISTFARWSDVPLVNLESALYHPCQGLADLLTIDEKIGNPQGKPITITWAYHPRQLPMAVPNTILVEAAKHGMNIRLAHPEGWELDSSIMKTARDLVTAAGGSLNVFNDMESAMDGSRVVYAKSWGSLKNYGQADREKAAKTGLRDKWRVTLDRMARTDRAIFMHCLPVRRNVVVDDAVLDSEMNAAYDEAENRLHVQKALLLRMLADR